MGYERSTRFAAVFVQVFRTPPVEKARSAIMTQIPSCRRLPTWSLERKDIHLPVAVYLGLESVFSLWKDIGTSASVK